MQVANICFEGRDPHSYFCLRWLEDKGWAIAESLKLDREHARTLFSLEMGFWISLNTGEAFTQSLSYDAFYVLSSGIFRSFI